MTAVSELSDRHRADVDVLLVRSVEAEVGRSEGAVDGRRLLQRARGELDRITAPASEEWEAYRTSEAAHAPRRLRDRLDARALGGALAAAVAAGLAALFFLAAEGGAAAGNRTAVTGAALTAAAALAGFLCQVVLAHVWARESQAGRRNQPGGVEQLRLAWLTAVEVRGIRPYLAQQRVVPQRAVASPARQRAAPRGGSPDRGREARVRSSLARSFDQLPERGEPFLGRREHLAQIGQWVHRDRARTESRPTVVVVHGPSGAGRTMLARWAAHDMRELFRGACLVDLRGQSVDPLPTRDAVLHVMNRFGAPQDQLLFREGTRAGGTPGGSGQPPEPQLNRLLERYQRHLARLPVVLILDDATDAEQIRTLVPERSESLVLVTAAEPLPLEDVRASVHQLRLEPLDDTAAAELLAAAERAAAESPAAADNPAAEHAGTGQGTAGTAGTGHHAYGTGQGAAGRQRLLDHCAGLPLLLTLAGPALRTRAADRLAADLAAAGPPGTPDPVERMLELRYADQPDSARRLLRRLALVGRASLGARAAAALLDTDQRQAVRHLDELARAGLLHTVRGRRYRLHDLVRRFARARLWEEESPAQHAAAQERLIRSYAELADTVIRLVDGQTSTRADLLPAAAGGHGFTSLDAALQWLDEETSFITATLRYAVEGVDPQAAQHLLGALADYCLLRGDLYRLGELNELTQSVDQGLLTRSVTWRTGVAERQLGELDKAHSTLSRVVGLYRDAQHQAGTARALRDLGITLQQQGALNEAADKLQEALELQPRDVRPGDRAWTLHALAAVERERGRVVTAVEQLGESLELHRGSGSVHGEAWARLHLGQTLHRRGSLARAEEELRASATLYERSRDVRGQAWALTELGTVRLLTGDSTAGVAELRAALARHRDNGDSRGVAWTLYDLGQALEDTGDRVGAMRTQEQARTMFNRMPDRYGVACARHHEARVTRDVRAEGTGSLRNSGFARQLLAAARGDYRRAGAVHGEAWSCVELAVIDAGNGRPDRALDLVDEASRLFTEGYGEGRPDGRGVEWARFLRCTLLPLAAPGGTEVGEAVAEEELAALRRDPHPHRDPRLADALDNYVLMLNHGSQSAADGRDADWPVWRLGMVPTRSAGEILGVLD